MNSKLSTSWRKNQKGAIASLNGKVRKGIMWASSRMGPRGFRVSLARTATKEDCTEVEFSASEIIPCYRRAIVVLNTAPPPPPRKGGLPPYLDYTGVCRWTGYGFWSLSLNMVYNFMRIFPCPPKLRMQNGAFFLFVRLQHWFWRGRGVSVPCYSVRDCRLRNAECHEVSVAKIMEHSNFRTKCNNIICSGYKKNNLNSLSTALSALGRNSRCCEMSLVHSFRETTSTWPG